jgi:uncharacterized protein YkwD
MCGWLTTESEAPIPLTLPNEGAEEGIVNSTNSGSSEHRVRRFGVRIAVAAGLATLAIVPYSIHAASADDSTTPQKEAQFVALINRLRVSQGLPELATDPELTRVARNWTEKMAKSGTLTHNAELCQQVQGGWKTLGENVGRGPDDVAVLHDAFVNSPHHYANLISPKYDSIGVGIVFSESGEMFVTEQFIGLDPNQPKNKPPMTAQQCDDLKKQRPPAQLALKPSPAPKKSPAKKPAPKKAATPTSSPNAA